MKPWRYPHTKAIAYYLPQYHPVPENDEWWGSGFTDWRSCATARPLFPGHHQPKIPADLGFYDLRRPEVQHEQARLARAHGVRGFCHYFYWFDGRRILDRPTELLLANRDIDIEFCLCWANENWSRRWDGQDREILLSQTYDPATFSALARELLKYFEDDRYITVGGKPLFVIYRPADVAHLERLLDTLREAAEKNGFPGLYILGAETFVRYGRWEDPRLRGLDGAVEFPPHGTESEWVAPVGDVEGEFEGVLFDQLSTFVNSALRPDPSYPLFRCLFPAWDNTPRRGTRGSIYLGSSPKLFSHWFDHHCRWTERAHGEHEQLLFINAWNEWAEGAYLEPDLLNGSGYLEAIRDVLRGEADLECPISPDEIAELDFRERSRFAAEYLRRAGPLLGRGAQFDRNPRPRFPLAGRLYDHRKDERYLMSIQDEGASSWTPARLRSLVSPRSFGQWKRDLVLSLRVERPSTFGERIRNATFHALRKSYRALRSSRRALVEPPRDG